MAKVKAKLRLSSIEGKAGTIYYSVSHKKIVRHITTNIHVLPEHWNQEKQRITAVGKDVKRMQNRIDSDLTVLRRIIRELESGQRPFTTHEIISRFRTPERHVVVLDFFREQMQLFVDCNKRGTAMNYRSAANVLSTFLGDKKFCFSELTAQFVEEYNDYLLRKGLIRNSQSFHMRILRSVYNKAVRRGYTEQTHPFRDVYTGIDHTRKRAVNEDVISQLIHLEIKDKEALVLARDMFLFSFYTRGMAFVDVAYLRKSDIQGGVIHYVRRKTGHELSIRVEPCIQAIIDRYTSRVRRTPYVFPVLKTKDEAECFQRYKKELRKYNSRLSQLSKRLGLEYNLSSYTSRHSWATMARNHNVPIAVISAGMGHASERTTQIYLASLENTVIDNANKGLLDKFNNLEENGQ